MKTLTKIFATGLLACNVITYAQQFSFENINSNNNNNKDTITNKNENINS